MHNFVIWARADIFLAFAEYVLVFEKLVGNVVSDDANVADDDNVNAEVKYVFALLFLIVIVFLCNDAVTLLLHNVDVDKPTSLVLVGGDTFVVIWLFGEFVEILINLGDGRASKEVPLANTFFFFRLSFTFVLLLLLLLLLQLLSLLIVVVITIGDVGVVNFVDVIPLVVVVVVPLVVVVIFCIVCIVCGFVVFVDIIVPLVVVEEIMLPTRLGRAL